MEVIILVVVIFFASFAEGMSGIGMALYGNASGFF